MARNRLWQAGAETGSVKEFTAISQDPRVSTDQKNTGAYSFRDGDQVRYYYQVIPGTRQISTGFFVYGNTSVNTVRFAIRDVSNNLLVDLYFKTTGAIALRVNTSEEDVEAAINVAEWHHFGIDVKIDNASGWATVYRDGVEIMTFAGDTGNANITNVLFGHFSGAGDNPCYFDDLYIDDTTGEGAAAAPPILRFYPTTLNADGNYSQWLGSDGNNVNNYQLVDEVPPSDVDYVTVTGSNKLDSYNMTTFTLDDGATIEAIIPTVRSKRTSTTEQILLGARLSATDLLGTVQNPNTNFGYLFERLTDTPGGGDWQQSDLDNVELLVMSTGTY